MVLDGLRCKNCCIIKLCSGTDEGELSDLDREFDHNITHWPIEDEDGQEGTVQ